ncbi:MAG TPA: DUF1398 family protein [Rhizomicrobium sp.]|nr:DUF1398 family protein [Rhizomicrobium sp.]
MDQATRDTIAECTKGSAEERMSFPEVVMRLAAAGVERYHADLVRGEKTYYLPDGRSGRVASGALEHAPATAFDGAGVGAAVRAIQAGGIGYRGFCAAIAAAGCAGYIVTLAGRRAVYYGRTGETFVEPFPPAP